MPLGKLKKKNRRLSVEEAVAAVRKHALEIKPFIPVSQEEQLLRYLQKIYEFGRREIRIGYDDEMKAALLRLVPKMRMKGRFNKYRVLLNLQAAESPTTARQTNRHARALMNAHLEKVKPEDFIEFVKKNGGVNKLGDRALTKATSKESRRQRTALKRERLNDDDDDWGIPRVRVGERPNFDPKAWV